jgi:ribonucleoside-diphosphate reductase alpha chain
MTRFAAPIAEQIWDLKYRFKTADGTPIDENVEQTWDRIAHALAEAEEPGKRNHHQLEFIQALDNFKYLPAGRITSGAGTGRAVTLFNCFVMGTVPDSMGGIFDMLKEAALTMQQGGGIGYDFSTIRPKGAIVKGVAADASGPLSFMDVWDAMCRTIMSAGSRRGAMMATMRDSHPDVMDFITAKNDPNRLRMFNMSVLISDNFMDAVKSDSDWYLSHEVAPTLGDDVSETFFDVDGVQRHIYSKVKARELWDAIMQNTYDQAEPGVIFIDRINNANNLNYCETIAATNPCGEQPLPPYGACLLGSINMARLITNPFTDAANLDIDELNKLVATAVRMMDNVVDVSNFPLPQQREEAENKRRIGLGVTGLADALLMIRETYGSESAAKITDTWMHAIARAAYLASVELAKEKGAFPLFDAEKYLQSGNMLNMDEDVRDAIREHGIRNALLTSIAPTGTISLYAGNVSSGIEPVFAYSYTRKILNDDQTHRYEAVEDYAFAMYRDMWQAGAFNGGLPPVPTFDMSDLPDYFVNAQTLDPMSHIRMQAAAQRWIDSSISKTINVPEDIAFDDFKEVYMAAWDSGCKGCTTYRPNDVTGSILSIDTAPVAPDAVEIEELLLTPEHIEMGLPSPREKIMRGATYKLKYGDLPEALYITINDQDIDGALHPYEIFINTKDPDHLAWTTMMTCMVSAIFRRGGDVKFVVDELKAIFDPKGGAWHEGKFLPSLIAAIGGVIESHMISTGYIGVKVSPVFPLNTPKITGDVPPLPQCPKCKEHSLQMKEGCLTCGSCGHSKCG